MKTYLLSEEVKPNQKVFTASPDTRLTQALDAMRSAAIHHLLVVEGRDLLGVISDRDIFEKAMTADFHIDDSKTVADVMNAEVPTLTEETDVGQALSIMKERGTSAVALVEGGRLKGILTESDMLTIVDRILNDRELSVSDRSQVYLSNPLLQKVMKTLAELGF